MLFTKKNNNKYIVSFVYCVLTNFVCHILCSDRCVPYIVSFVYCVLANVDCHTFSALYIAFWQMSFIIESPLYNAFWQISVSYIVSFVYCILTNFVCHILFSFVYCILTTVVCHTLSALYTVFWQMSCFKHFQPCIDFWQMSRVRNDSDWCRQRIGNHTRYVY